MSHGIDALAWLRELPVVLILAAAVVTRLGDTWFVLLAITGVYLLADRLPVIGAGIDRRDGAVLLGMTFAAIAVVIALKALGGHPRPPGAGTPPSLGVPSWARPFLAALTTATGFSLPSGHALQSTVVYGGLALVGGTGSRRRRLLVAAILVGLIALSRVILGVHYVLDVVAGLAVGVFILGVLWWAADDRPGLALGMAVVAALVAVLVAGFDVDALAILGAAIGARLAWGAAGGTVPARPADDGETRRLVRIGGPLLIGFGAITFVSTALPASEWRVVGGFLAAGVGAGTLVVLPALGRTRERGPRGP